MGEETADAKLEKQVSTRISGKKFREYGLKADYGASVQQALIQFFCGVNNPALKTERFMVYNQNR